MHPELVRAIARDHDAARLVQARERALARHTATAHRSFISGQVRRFVGTSLLTLGERMLSGGADAPALRASGHLSTSR